MKKDLGRINAFLQALDRPEHRALCAGDTLLVSLCQELARRQTRYRRLHDDYGDATCSSCPHGGCCRREFVRVFDLVFRLALGAPIPPAKNADDAFCSFLDAGCTLVPAPLPRICVTFQCGTLQNSGPAGFGAQATTLAAHAADITLVSFTYVARSYMLLDADSELTLDSSAALIARQASLPLRLLPRDRQARPSKRALPSETLEIYQRSTLPITS